MADALWNNIEILWGFFIASALGYGGGPALIPLIGAQVVTHYHWMTDARFGEIIAFANALPSPIVTKLAGYIGYQVGGITGAFFALAASTVPTVAVMIVSMGFLSRHRDTPQVKALSQWVLPVVLALMVLLSVRLIESGLTAGWPSFLFLFGAAALALEVFKLHPALVISGGLVYGAFFLAS